MFEHAPLERLAARRPADGLQARRLSGSAWTRCATRHLLEKLWDSGNAALETLELTQCASSSPDTRATSARAWCRCCSKEGYEVSGPGQRPVPRCTFDGESATIPEIIKDVRDVDREGPRGLRRRHPPGRAFQRSARRLRPRLTDEINTRPPSGWRSIAKQGRRAALRLRVLVQQLRRGGRRLPGRAAAFNPVTPYGVSKVNVEQAVAELASDKLQPHVPARIDRLRLLAAHPLRPGAQQPDGLGVHDRQGLPEERRHAVAADRPRRGHRAAPTWRR